MIRFANAYDVSRIAELLETLFESPNYRTVTHDPMYVMQNLLAVLDEPSVDLIVAEQDGVVQGAACAMTQETFLCPDMNMYEQFVVSDNPMQVRYLIQELKRLKVERGCKRLIMGISTMQNPRYVRLLHKLGFQDFGQTFKLE